MVPGRILGTLTASLSSPMVSCGRDPICRPSELRSCPLKVSFTDHDCGALCLGWTVEPCWGCFRDSGAIAKITSLSSRGKAAQLQFPSRVKNVQNLVRFAFGPGVTRLEPLRS